ncbi:MAG: HEAT repeat domain-containing protein [bacterium]
MIKQIDNKMSYYDLTKKERETFKAKIENSIKLDFLNNKYESILKYATDEDTYVRRNVYISIGKIYREEKKHRKKIISLLKILVDNGDEKVRQVVVYSAGEIGKVNFEDIIEILEQALFDHHNSVLNAVTGALKQLGDKNPIPTLRFVKKHLRNLDTNIQVRLLHGLELRGRTHPEDILPILAEYQDESQSKVMKMIIHILGQISYKQGCLEKVMCILKSWKNKNLVEKALKEIIKVHRNYAKFSYLSPEEVQDIIKKEFETA